MADCYEENAEILASRKAKLWRHEDRELTSSHTLWNTAFAIHAAIMGAVGLFVGNDDFPAAKVFFPYVFGISFVAMVMIVVLIFLLRRYDRTYAEHFGATHQGRKYFPAGFDKDESDRECDKATDSYRFWRKYLELVVLVLLFASLLCFFCTVVSHK